jgi:hypothetical protein
VGYAEAAQAGLEAEEGARFAFHCALAPMLAPAVDIKRADNDFTTVRKMVGIWRSIAEILLDGDYYPLTPPGRSGKEWVIWQFNQPRDLGGWAGSAGFVQAIRLAGSDEERARVSLKGLDREMVYILQEAETGERRELPGASLLDEGFVFELPRRQGTIWTYSEKTY